MQATTAQTSYPNHAQAYYAAPNLFTLTNDRGNDVQQGTSEGGNKIIVQGSNFGPKGEERQQPHVVLHLRDVGLRVEGFQNQVFVGRAAAEPHVVRHLLGIWLRVQG